MASSEGVKVQEEEETDVEKLSTSLKPPPRGKVKKEEPEIPSTSTATSTPTVNLADFLSLLSPKAIEKCICCNSSLQTTLPAALFHQEKIDVLKSFSNILNLPFLLEPKGTAKNNGRVECDADGDDEDADDEADAIDFPFCLQCFKDKVKKLICMYEKLQVVQENFEKVKESVMSEILRVFISNMVTDKKIPVAVVRERKVHEGMLKYFKRHSEKRMKNLQDGETQTEAPAQQFFPAFTPMVQNYSARENSSYGRYGGRKRRGGNRKTNNSFSTRPLKTQTRRNSANYYDSHLYPPSNISEGTDNAHDNTNSSMDMPNLASCDYGNYSQTQSSMDGFPNGSAVNGMAFEGNGLLTLDEDYFNNYGYGGAQSSHSNSYMNGFNTVDPSSLNDEFNSVLGLMEPQKFPGSSKRNSLTMHNSSPPKLEPEFRDSEHQVVASTNNKLKIRKVAKNKEVVECDICGKEMTRDGLKIHMESIHTDEKPYKCRGCDKKFARRDHWRDHEERHVISSKREYFCHRCGEGSSLIMGKSAYVEHCTTAHKVEDEIVEYFHFCDADECYESYKVKEDFLNHLVTHWEIGYQLQCSICDKSFADRNNLESHELEAHNSMDQYFGCNFCQMGFVQEFDYTQHIRFHLVKMPEERLFECDICGKSFPSPNRLRCHKYNVHIYRGKGKLKDEASPVKRRKKSLNCKVCKKSYTSEKRLEKHMLKHEEEDEEEDEVPVEDEEAEVESEAEQEEEENEAKEEDGGSENEPDNELEEADVPDPEDSNEGRGQGNIKCQYCSRKLKTRQDVRKHLVKAHSDKCLTGGTKNCSICWYLFKSESKLQEHIDMKHGKLKCEECGHLCTTPLTFKQHMKRHDPDLNFICDICNQRFSSQWVLQRHTNIVHLKKKKVKVKATKRRYSTRRTTVSEEDPEASSNASNIEDD